MDMKLELKLLHGKDITAFNFFQPLSIYLAASISSPNHPDRAQKQTTPADKEGDGSPEWNHELRFDLAGIPIHGDDDAFLRIDLLHEGGLFGDRQIGEVRVPLSHFVEQVDGVVRLVRYQVNGVDGKPNGVLTFSYKIVGKLESDGWAIVPHQSTGSENPRPEIIRYPSLGEFDYSYRPPEAYYAPPPPPPPVVYPTQLHPVVWPPPGPPVHLHHHHHYHHHHYSWSHFSFGDGGGRWPVAEEGEGWSRDPYGSPLN